jgi:hypothetical protein
MLAIHGSTLTLRFIKMSELEFFLVSGGFGQNTNTMEFANFLEKLKNLMSYMSSYIGDYIM